MPSSWRLADAACSWSTKGSQLSRLHVWLCAGSVRGGTHAEPEELARNGEQLGVLCLQTTGVNIQLYVLVLSCCG
jgi:hypothetical protein